MQKDIAQAVKVLQALEDINQSQLADRLHQTKQALSRTINKSDHRIKADLLPIAAALGCELRLQFVRPDGSVAAAVGFRADDPE